MQRRITNEEMQAAARQLGRSERGREVLERLLALMEEDGLELNLLNQRAFLVLLGAAWTGRKEAACDLMREMLRGSGASTARAK